ncbi:MAG: hypothetical protein ACI8VC_002578 [Candidatus Endobugula sp.]|jgi:hypothetical protein
MAALCEKMNRSEALEKINYSLSTEEARVITPKGEIYEDYVKKLSNILISSVIVPVKVNVTSTCVIEGEYNVYKNAVVWAIAINNGNWLLTLEKENEFALGFGDDPSNIKMHGFSSSDALGEWCA